jgi:hypothetical protein
MLCPLLISYSWFILHSTCGHSNLRSGSKMRVYNIFLVSLTCSISLPYRFQSTTPETACTLYVASSFYIEYYHACMQSIVFFQQVGAKHLAKLLFLIKSFSTLYTINDDRFLTPMLCLFLISYSWFILHSTCGQPNLRFGSKMRVYNIFLANLTCLISLPNCFQSTTRETRYTLYVSSFFNI